MNDPFIKPVGIVRSHFSKPENIPLGGAEAEVEVFPEFEEALDGIEENSHIIILSFLHLAKREPLRIHPRGRE